MNIGFYISRIIGKGKGLLDSEIEFKPGCNVVIGDSDRGKTTLFNVLDYLLGKDNKGIENMPPEGVPYTTFLMEICTKDNDIYTIKRIIGSNDVYVKKCGIYEYENNCDCPMKFNTKGSSNIPFSDFMLKITEIPNLKIATSSKKAPVNISYATIRHLIMVDETKITNNKYSPFYENENSTLQTKYQNFISYLMTGVDDSDFRPDEDPTIKRSRLNGKLEFISDELGIIGKELERLGDVSYISISDDIFIKQYQDRIKIMSEELTAQYDLKKKLLIDKQRIEVVIRNLVSFIERMKELKSFYETDLGRLKTILQGAKMLELLPNTKCPLCGQTLESTNIDATNGEDYFKAIVMEYNNTRIKINDISSLISSKEYCLIKAEDKLQNTDNELRQIDAKIKSIEPDITNIKEILSRSEINHEKQVKYFQLQEKQEQLNIKLSNIQDTLNNITSKQTSTRRKVIKQDYFDLVKDILISWNFMTKDEDITFDYKQFDIMIGDRHRRSYGQGNRGVSCAAMMIALMDFCHNSNRAFSSLLVLDSPMSTRYDGKTSNEDNRKIGVLDAFATYCNNRQWDYQIIIIDNKISTNEFDLSSLNNINFIKFGTEERNGLFIGKTKE